ncbi:iron hydrogenase [Serendipita vermifera]|nr:iron hydrogenase [Serendipita vermifera]
MAFSGALTLTDLNDFITPSQACIKPVETKNVPPPDTRGLASTLITVDSSGVYHEVEMETTDTKPKSRKLEKAEISLNDCLACSGCITSAETVLIQMQSHEEVMSVLQSNPPPSSPDHRVPVLSISPQSIASLASSARVASTSKDALGVVTAAHVWERLRTFAVEELGFKLVFDTTFARHVALREHVREFEERKELARYGRKNGAAAEPVLPMLASACPGWICYAEKTHAEMLPLISNTKSPQQVMGTMIKNWVATKLGKRPDQMYHVTVMPCYDKKLEASRQDFYNEQYRTRDVDCVITTGELELLLQERNWDLSAPATPSATPTEFFGIPNFVPHQGSSSGSWLQAIMDHVQEREKKENGRDCSVKSKIIRSADYEEVTIEAITADGQAEVVFRGAKCYGFRNLQNIVRKVAKETGIKGSGAGPGRGRGRVTGAAMALRARRGKDTSQIDPTNVPAVVGEDRPYDYVEVMACPAGCVNGGGQARRPAKLVSEPGVEAIPTFVDTAGMGSRWGDREWVKVVEETYWEHASTPTTASKKTTDGLASRIEQEVDSREVFRTQYRAVVSDVVGLNVTW